MGPGLFIPSVMPDEFNRHEFNGFYSSKLIYWSKRFIMWDTLIKLVKSVPVLYVAFQVYPESNCINYVIKHTLLEIVFNYNNYNGLKIIFDVYLKPSMMKFVSQTKKCSSVKFVSLTETYKQGVSRSPLPGVSNSDIFLMQRFHRSVYF